jgi:hypothetical protein
MESTLGRVDYMRRWAAAQRDKPFFTVKPTPHTGHGPTFAAEITGLAFAAEMEQNRLSLFLGVSVFHVEDCIESSRTGGNPP